jgi:integrase
LEDANFLQVAREKKSATRWAAFSIMQYGGSSLTAIQSQVRARVLVFVFLQSVSERLTFSKLKRCISCWGYWGIREKAMVFFDMPSGLRRRELAGLKWEDFDFKNLHVSVTRSLVGQHVGPVKTEASRKLMPIDEYVAHDLLAWYEVTPYKKPSDYVWATNANRAEAKRGKQPVWLSAVMRDYIQPSARKLGINKKMSWHTFRHYAESGIVGIPPDAPARKRRGSQGSAGTAAAFVHQGHDGHLHAGSHGYQA